MRNFILLLAVAGLLCGCNKSDNLDDSNTIVKIPDAKFKAYMVENFDTNGDGEISVAEAALIDSIRIPGDYHNRGDIESLKGVEYCTALT